MEITLKKSKFSELLLFAESEILEENRKFIIPYEYSRHVKEYEQESIKYLSIYSNNSQKLQGYVILNREENTASVEFRRIVVFSKGEGIGSMVVKALDEFCKREYGARRIWLDVFSDNLRGIHIYTKNGYVFLGNSYHNDKGLLIYEKILTK